MGTRTSKRTSMLSSIIFLVFFMLLAACVPQAELVKTRSEMTELRESVKAVKSRIPELHKRLDMLDANIKGTLDAQKVMADYGAKSDQLTTDIQILQGKIEENNFRITELAQKLDDKSFKISELSAKIDELETRVKALVVAASAPGAVVTASTGTAVEKEKQAAAPKTIDPTEAYRQAMNDFNSGNFDLALAGFQNYLTQFPDTSQADKAQYWIGECFYSKKDFSKAVEAFNKIIKVYPKSDKIPGAKLKIGLSYMNEKSNVKAKEYFNKVIKEYPGTKEAELAKDKLKKIGK